MLSHGRISNGPAAEEERNTLEVGAPVAAEASAAGRNLHTGTTASASFMLVSERPHASAAPHAVIPHRRQREMRKAAHRVDGRESATKGDSPEVSPEVSRHNARELRLHVFDRGAGVKFLVDSGSAISLLPRSYAQQKANSHELRLTAANGSNIATFGERVLTVDLGLRRAFSWAFVVADVRSAILGTDFLTYYDLIVDLKRRALPIH